MDATPAKQLAQKDISADLRATLAARRELDPEMEEHLIEAFLARIEQRVDARVDEKVGQLQLNRSKPTANKNNDDSIGMVAVTLALGIPLMVVAGIFLHGAGVIAVVAGLVLINALFFVAQVEGRRH